MEARAKEPLTSESGGRRLPLLAVWVIAALISALACAEAAWAQAFTVTNLNDSGPGSLRAAISAANSAASAASAH